MQNRTLYFGDNLEILRKKIEDESFDLIYLDPPFNSNRNYNVLFKEGIQDSPAQIKAFDDSWHWTRESKQTFDYLVTKTNEDISNLVLALEKMVGHNDMLAYLTMMTVRLIELHRVLKKTGSLYLHCDPTASHYLKIVLDIVFGKKNFKNEIVWRRTFAHNDPKRFGRNDDRILFYTKTDNYFFNAIFTEYDESYIKDFFRNKDKNGFYQAVVLTGPNINPNDPTWKNYNPSQSRRSWSVPKRIINKLVGEEKAKKMSIAERLDLLHEKEYIIFSKNGVPRFKQYLHEMKGAPAQEVWTDINPISAQAKERLGYPTQKPEALLERIIKASSKDGDWILDPFCGCGTTVAVSEKLKRNWVGINVTSLAINLIKYRIRNQFNIGRKQIFVDGLPTDLAGAKELFKKDPFEFEYWALDLINAMPAQSKSKDNMRGADKGIDGIVTFHKNSVNGKLEYGKAIIQVKGGKVQRNQIATLKGDVEREKAEAGVFITLEKPTKPMKGEAVDAGTFTTSLTNKFEFPKIQILTIEELLQGKKPELPRGLVKNYYKEAKPSEVENDNLDQRGLGL
ncbi:MAG: restriction endonuclease [Candidatus Pacebacteria bacterium]|nr:restriction endonuclease [Candidatus Paceibacterota bacterium]